MEVLKVRFNKTLTYISKLTPDVFIKVSWAKTHHSNKDFRDFGLPSGEKFYAAINNYGLQDSNSYDYIGDYSIYLSDSYFLNPNEQIITIIHEVSHLIEGDMDFNKSQFLDNSIDPFINTIDYYAGASSPDALTDSKQWEDYLLELMSL